MHPFGRGLNQGQGRYYLCHIIVNGAMVYACLLGYYVFNDKPLTEAIAAATTITTTTTAPPPHTGEL